VAAAGTDNDCFLSGKWKNGFIALGIPGCGTRFWLSQREILPRNEKRQCGLNGNNRKNATEALARRMQQQKSAAGRMQTEECWKNATDKCRKSAAEVEYNGSGKKNATAAAVRRMCREGRERKQCNRNSRKNEVFEMEERVVNNAIEKIRHNAIQ
jgi:hypothetical protein